MKQQIGIFGGTFNPIHNGHLMIARCAMEQFALDPVLFVPTGHTAYKDYAGTDMSRHRCRMVELAIAEEPRFALSRVEIENPAVNYTYRTLRLMQERFPEAELFFLIGGDSLRDLPAWRYPEIICGEAVILVASRREKNETGAESADRDLWSADDDTDRLIGEMTTRFGGDIRRLDTPFVDLSSTEIRRRVSEHLEIRSMVPPAVADYIYANGLYRSEIQPD